MINHKLKNKDNIHIDDSMTSSADDSFERFARGEIESVR